MKRHTCYCLIFLIVFSLSGFLSCDDVTVKATKRTTTYGDVIGFEDDENSYAWLEPIGDFRWKASVPADKWSGTQKALEFCSECTQVRDMLAFTATIFENNKTILGSEDCLYLKI
ncbi:MAG: carboxylesterase family protein [Proteobacteria bacterium]|nr:carboxylesterase family protein [Pseudomonadota bacterium]